MVYTWSDCIRQLTAGKMSSPTRFRPERENLYNKAIPIGNRLISGMVHKITPFTAFALFCALACALAWPSSAAAPAPCELFGKLTIYGAPAPVGSVVTAYIGGNERGRITTIVEGEYGSSCPFGPKLKVQPLEGEYTGIGVLRIQFYANGLKTDQEGVFSPGARQWLDLSVSRHVVIASFSANPRNGLSPLAVSFSDESTPAPASWTWSFGDGGQSAGQNPVHTYRHSGNYTVTLYVSGPYGSASHTAPAYIVVDPLVLQPFPGQHLLPGDPDDDGYYEDLNGNGAIDFDDLRIYFLSMGWIPGNNPVKPFDYNGNGGIEFADLLLLFRKI